MFAKQTCKSASLVVLLAGSSVIAYAEPAPVDQVEDEVRPPTGRFVLGAGFSNDENLIATARIAQDDLFGTGHALSLGARISALRQSFRIDYTTADLGGGLTLGAELFNDRRVMPGFARRGAGGGLTLNQQFGPHLRTFVGYRYEHVTAETEPVAVRGEPGPPLAAGAISSIRAGVIYDSRDRMDAPTRGTTFGAVYEVADPRLGSAIAFERVRGWVGHHRPLGPLTLHVGGSLTQIASRDGMPLPSSERLFLDGSRDIRGFVPFALGPIDALGRPVGGTTKLTARAELEVPLIKRIGLSAVGFVDAGGIFEGVNGQLGRSVGVGLLWRSPIGVLRFDWALPLDGAGPPTFVFGAGMPW